MTVGLVLAAVAGVVLFHPSPPAPGAVAAGAWKVLPPATIAARSEPSVVWTRKAMIVWGGAGDAGPLGDGAAYDAGADVWTTLPPAPLSPRVSHTAVWTGDRMVVFGGLGLRDGCNRPCALADGAAYDPATKTWTPLAPAPLAPRSGHTAVWLQNRMVVWGGAGDDGTALADGASYDPATDSWTPLPPAPIAGRFGHRTVATVNRMLVWGGSTAPGTDAADGAVYNPSVGMWTPMAAAPASLTARDSFAGVWTGAQLLVWGGYGRSDTCAPCPQADGAAYHPGTDTWTTVAPSPLSGRGGQRAVWTSRDLLVWGGFDTAPQADGALYNPTDDTWARLVTGPLAPRQGQAMVWTGQQLLLWGGQGAGGKLADGAALTLTAA